MDKKELGKQIEALRKECGVSTYELEQKGIHPHFPATIEKGQKGYSINSLIKYLNAIDEDVFLCVGKKKIKRFRCTYLSDYYFGSTCTNTIVSRRHGELKRL